ncbi:purine-nucleoside phosphorylase [Buchnera aphidicola (Mollitrichosiphum nigrofasciatum)]|uniref:purine-nucleoside phosphorylase n=1 Tax=Buchnera aphidicola TaxID=9 RepID=UPI0031B8572A
MTTLHINAKLKDFSKRVLIAGDPLRVKYIAEKYFKNSVQITNVRSMLGYTGMYKNKKISIMSHGIGIPSCMLYVQELIKYFNVKKIIRIGTCGVIDNDINLHDILISIGACTNSKINRLRFKNYDLSAIANFNLLYKAKKISKKMGLKVRFGNFFTSDFFYEPNRKVFNLMQKFNILAIEMETVALYSLALELKIKALSICTVTDHIYKNKKVSVNDRILLCNDMIELALETIIL